MPEPLRLPFAAGIALQRYLRAEEGLVNCHEEGCSHWYVDLSLPTDQPSEWSPSRVASLRRAAALLGCRPILHGNFRAPLASEIPEVREGVWRYLKQELFLAAELNAPLILHGGGMVEPRPTRTARLDALRRALAMTERLRARGEQYGVEVWLENLSHYPRHRPFSYVFTTVGDFRLAIREAPALRFVLDVGHAHVNQKASVALLDAFTDRIRALSFSDNDARSDAHLGLGRGTLPVAEIVSLVRRKGWHGLVVFETRGSPGRHGVATLAALACEQNA